MRYYVVIIIIKAIDLSLLFSLGAIANGIPGSYSLSLAIQCIWSQCARVPRIAWCILGNLVALAFSILAYYKFQDTMSNFCQLLLIMYPFI